MKKLILGAAAALLVCAASCDKSTEGAKYFSDQATDSLLMSLGQVAGGSLNVGFQQLQAQDPNASKEMFVKGIQYAMAADTSDMFVQGMNMGLRLQRQLAYYRSMGIDVNSRKFMEYFKKAFLADSLPTQLEMNVYGEANRRWEDSLATAKRAYDRALLENSPEARENAEKGDNYIKAKAAQDDSVKVAPSGLGYKIINQGNGDKVDPNGRVRVKYTARTIDGKVLDRAAGLPISLQSRTEGLKEGVSMLNEGGVAVFYVPGRLAYGVDVPQGIAVGPNELIIYEVEVLGAPAN